MWNMIFRIIRLTSPEQKYNIQNSSLQASVIPIVKAKNRISHTYNIGSTWVETIQ